MLVAGGFNADGYVDVSELFDPMTETWSIAASINEERQRHTASTLNNGKVLITGGVGSGVSLSSAELYLP